jgi:CheY-like chemotaxis protein
MSVIKKPTILIVDDNRDAADTLAMLIESMGFRAMTAYDTPAGLKLARDISPQIIFHDIGMSGMDGYMAARQLRSEAQFAKTYLIALTAYTATVDRTQALLAGFDLHLSKPLRYEDLMQVLNQAKKK